MSPSRMYSGVEWVTSSRRKEPWDATINGEQMGSLFEPCILTMCNTRASSLSQDIQVASAFDEQLIALPICFEQWRGCSKTRQHSALDFLETTWCA